MSVSPDTLAVLVLNPLRNGRSALIDATTTLHGVMDSYTRLGDEASADEMAHAIQDVGDVVQRLTTRIERVGSEAG